MIVLHKGCCVALIPIYLVQSELGKYEIVSHEIEMDTAGHWAMGIILVSQYIQKIWGVSVLFGHLVLLNDLA